MCQVFITLWRDERAMAAATRSVFSTKYAVAAPRSGRATVVSGSAALASPSQLKTAPAACTVMMSDAMLNSVRYAGLISFLLK